jgi:hypothetical protein
MERRKIPCKLNYYLFCLSNNWFSIFSLFSAIGKEAEKQRDIVWEDVGCAGGTRLAL